MTLTRTALFPNVCKAQAIEQAPRLPEADTAPGCERPRWAARRPSGEGVFASGVPLRCKDLRKRVGENKEATRSDAAHRMVFSAAYRCCGGKDHAMGRGGAPCWVSPL